MPISPYEDPPPSDYRVSESEEGSSWQFTFDGEEYGYYTAPNVETESELRVKAFRCYLCIKLGASLEVACAHEEESLARGLAPHDDWRVPGQRLNEKTPQPTQDRV